MYANYHKLVCSTLYTRGPSWSRSCDSCICDYLCNQCEMEPLSDKVFSIQHYVIKFVSDLREVRGFLRVLRFPPPIKLSFTIQVKYGWKRS